MATKLPFASEVSAYSDAELDQFLDASRLPNGHRVVTVQDPDNLPESFIQRLRDRVQPHSKAVDLDQVAARLLQPTPPRHRSPSPDLIIPSHSTTPSCTTPTPEELYQNFLRLEKESHAWLVREGGRPFYSIELLPDLSCHAEEYPEILRYWSHSSRPTWSVFLAQSGEWYDFKAWQRWNRPQSKDDMRRYNKSLKSLLARRSITPPPVEFQPDPAQQDKLTEWIEYACWACLGLRGMKKVDPVEYELSVARLGWIMDQVPLIQAELEHGPATDTTDVKRTLEEDDFADESKKLTAGKRCRGEEDAVDGSEGASAKQRTSHRGSATGKHSPAEALFDTRSPDATSTSARQSVSAVLEPKTDHQGPLHNLAAESTGSQHGAVARGSPRESQP
ncbi:hypothetical protein F4777DRAFT_569465 [Nemania sp. FL0916]|nr:hypothetical protein F4777DRAFT_569465 [Nemania sp. FL0916]